MLSLSKTTSLLIIALLVISFSGTAQKASIHGKVFDKKNSETLIGVNVVVMGISIGASTDLDGKFHIKNLDPGTYTVTLSYVSYATQTIKDIVLKAGENYQLNIGLEQSSSELQAVEITATANRQNVSTLLMEIKNSTVIADGISQEAIKRTPDKSVGESLKRVSGISVQDNRFVIIRGLGDRYNYTMLNRMPFSTTEPDRKAVSFDIFPSNLIDNLIISKTATPDLPGEFAGGIVQINTRDIPEENSFSISAGIGRNSQTTGKTFYHSEKGNRDWLGYDDGSRSFPKLGMGADSIRNLDIESRVELSKKFKNNWKIYEDNASPNFSLQSTLVKNFKLFGKESGLLAAMTYNNSYKTKFNERQGFEGIADTGVTAGQYRNHEMEYTNHVLIGGILNFAFKLNPNNKITLKNLISQNGNDKVFIRDGFAIKDNQYIKASSIEYSSTQLLSSQLQGEHYFEASKVKFQWGFSAGRMFTDVPDTRKMRYATNQLDLDETDSSLYYNSIGFSPSPFYGGKFYSKLTETIYNEKGDLIIPLKFLKGKQDFKAGTLIQQKFRNYKSRTLGYKIGNFLKFDYDNLLLPQDSIFMPEMISDSGFVIDDITNPYDKYYADVHLTAFYAMMDNSIFEKLRLLWGMRYELFQQRLYTRDQSNKKSIVNRKEPDWLPSANLIYSLTDKFNIRLSGSRTVVRPEFREIAQLAVYDFVEEATLRGNDTLVRGSVNNYDIRFEFYPGNAQVFSISGFYKDFTDPIEQTVQFESNKTYSFANVKGAKTYGMEFEFRIKPSVFFGKVNEKSVLNSFTLFSNLALIHSEVDLGELSNVSSDSIRPLQGQSPYVVNAGLQFYDAKYGIALTGVLNKIGDRIDKVGNNDYFNIIEASRLLTDIQVSKRIFKNGEIKITVSDVFNKKSVFYWDKNENNKYDEITDEYIKRLRFGTGYSIAFSYSF